MQRSRARNFADDRIKRGSSGCGVTITDVYTRYCQWCDDRGAEALSLVAFCESSRGMGYRIYLGDPSGLRYETANAIKAVRLARSKLG